MNTHVQSWSNKAIAYFALNSLVKAKNKNNRAYLGALFKAVERSTTATWESYITTVGLDKPASKER